VSKDTEVMQRFQQEAQSASAIGNQHIIDISDFGELPDGSTYFVMEFLDGTSLTSAIEESGRMPPQRVVHVARQLCEALGAAHERSIVHRDLKPDNIYLVKRGSDRDFVKVLDFGIAKVGGASSKLTRAGQVFGTPHYMSPEQCSGKDVDHRTDIYAVGVILYEMSCGRVPFDADNLMGILTKHLYEQPVPPRELPPPVEVPPGLEAVILRCLAKSAETRYQTMAELREDLDRLQAGATPEAVIHQLNRDSKGKDAAPMGDLAGAGSALKLGTLGSIDAPVAAPSRAPWIVAGLAALALAGAVGGYLAFRSTGDTPPPSPPLAGDPPAPPPAATPPPETPPPPAVVTVTEPAGTGTASAAAGGAEPAAPALASVMIVSEPPGAEVLLNGAVMGVTPLAVPRPSGAEIVNLTLRRVGYADRGVAITALAAAEMAVTLTARSGGRRPPSAPPPVGEAPPPPPRDPPPGRTTTGRSGGDGVINPWGEN
jgi:serine/threonine-protein kinase